jgi:energy-coupling factor transporter ATP-binding protein EcfA2
VQKEIAETTFAGLSQILPRGRLDNHCPLTASSSEAKPYRCFATSDDSDRLHCKRKLPVTEAERPHCARVWRDVDAEEVVKRGESVLITGPPGTGKSHLTRSLIKLLREKGERSTVLAKTHLAAHNVGGITINHFANKSIRRGKFMKGWVVVDEVSMVDAACWAQVNKLAYCEAKFILVGDFDQFLPIHDRWCGQVLTKTVEHSSLLHTMAEGNWCRLTHNHRSDPRLFDFCGSLCPGGSRSHLPIAEMVAAARQEFPETKRKADYNLCVSHAKRRRLNRESNVREGLYLATPPSKQANAPQNMWLQPGLRVMCICDGRRGRLFNHAFFTVAALGEHTVTLEDDNGTFDIKLEEAARVLRLTYALTYASIEGMTLPGILRLHDGTHPRMCWRKLNVGLSRGTAADNVEVV